METPVIKIFASSVTPRLQYITDFIFREMLGAHYEIVTDKRKFGGSPVVNYSPCCLKGACNIRPAGLLDESGIKKHNPSVEWRNGLPLIFPAGDDSDVPFDIFSASFYMITRYEEYNRADTDEHGRFSARNSLAYRNGFLDRPVVNLWVKELAMILVSKFPRLAFKRTEYKTLTTFDVDEPFKFRGKNPLRNLRGFLTDMGRNGSVPAERLRTISGKKPDPWDIFDYLIRITAGERADAMFFLPAADRSAYDRWPSWQNRDYRGLARSVTERVRSGLHTSYRATADKGLMIKEKNRLAGITGKAVEASRFHYIRFRMPYSYNNLEESGLREDHSMGFHDEPGFRAGTSVPFTFYDLEADRKTNLLVFPFQFMDATMVNYRKMKPSQCKAVIKSLIDEIKNTGGIFQSVWHNNIIASSGSDDNWRSVFEFTLNYQQENDNLP